MKSVVVFLFGFVLFCVAAQGEQLGDVKMNDNSGSAAFLQRLESSENGEEIHALVDEAYRSKDIGALRACWHFPKASVYFVAAFNMEESLDLKNSIALMMMRSAWHGDEEREEHPLAKRGVPIAANPSIEIVSRYLPEEGLKVGDYASVKRLQRPRYRFELADRLEAKMTGKALGGVSEKSKESDVSRSDVVDNGSSASPLDRLEEGAGVEEFPVKFYLLGSAVLVLVGASFLLIKKKNRGK